MAAASDTVTGFGPGASRADRSIPLFDGKRENFSIFELRLKTASMSMGLDGLLLRPEDFEQQLAQARLRTQPSARKGASALEPAELTFRPSLM